jgi:hypothetical protein
MKLKHGVKIKITDKEHPDHGESFYILSQVQYEDDMWLYGKDLKQVIADGYAESTQFETIK